MIGDAARDRGEMWVCGGEEVERDVRGEDLGWKRRGEEAWEASLEDLESCVW